MTATKRQQRHWQTRKVTFAVSFPSRRKKAKLKLWSEIRNEDAT